MTKTTQEHATQRYLDRPAAAKYLGVSTRTLDELLASGRLPVIRIGRRVLLDIRDLDSFMAAHRRAG